MKNCFYQIVFFFCLAALATIIFPPMTAYAQGSSTNRVCEKTLPDGKQIRYAPDGDEIIIEEFDPADSEWDEIYTWNGHPVDGDRSIIDIDTADGKPYLYVLLNDGTTFRLPIDDLTGKLGTPEDIEETYESNPEEIGGDKVYFLTSSAVFSSIDSGKTWQPDTAGLGSVFTYWFTLDTAQNIWLATASGLFKQYANSSTWITVSSFPDPSAIAVFADRKNRLYASSYHQAYVSSDTGSTWSPDTAGMGAQIINKFGGDRRGNVYAMANKMMWCSAGGTGSWARIDQTISSLDFEGNPYKRIFNCITGDSVLIAGTAYGIFTSVDHGTTWKESNKNIPAKVIFSFVHLPSGRQLISTDLGIYYMDPGAQYWTKTFPASGFLGGSPLFQDNANILYTLATKYDPSTFLSLGFNMVSTDGGLTWSPDTAGLGKQTQVTYFVDETGVQHLATIIPAALYMKMKNSSWKPDSAGFVASATDEVVLLATDKNGTGSIFVSVIDYLTGKGKLWKRPTAGGSWMLDTLGLNNSPMYVLTGDRAGNPIGGGGAGGVFRRIGGTWTKLPSPNVRGVNPASNSYVVSVDSSGTIFAGFSDFVGFNTSWHGIYFTTDYGSSWTYVGLDSIAVRGLVSFGDTTYAFTYAKGIYKLTRNGVINSVKDISLPISYYLNQNFPNPFNPTTRISYNLQNISKVNLTIYNLLGQIVAVLVNRIETAGYKEIEWNPANIASGVYFYRLEATSVSNPAKFFTQVRKMLVIK
ncbi:MAG: T9SS type A sorting domain-containing protein [Bacteroidota bacterium]